MSEIIQPPSTQNQLEDTTQNRTNALDTERFTGEGLERLPDRPPRRSPKSYYGRKKRISECYSRFLVPKSKKWNKAIIIGYYLLKISEQFKQ